MVSVFIIKVVALFILCIMETEVWSKLKTVIDPEMGINIVDMGLIYRVEIREGGVVFILMTLTSPACPLAGMFDDLVGGAVKQVEGVEKVDIELTFDPPWDLSKMSEEGKAELGMF